jgi:hypothetical protein
MAGYEALGTVSDEAVRRSRVVDFMISARRILTGPHVLSERSDYFADSQPPAVGVDPGVSLNAG